MNRILDGICRLVGYNFILLIYSPVDRTGACG